MKIRGKEIKFLRTVKTTSELAKLCPEQDLARFPELLDSGLPTTLETSAKLVHLLNEGYEMAKYYNDKSYTPQIISEEELMYLDDETFATLVKEAMASFNNGAETTVETEVDETKKKVKENQV